MQSATHLHGQVEQDVVLQPFVRIAVAQESRVVVVVDEAPLVVVRVRVSKRLPLFGNRTHIGSAFEGLSISFRRGLSSWRLTTDPTPKLLRRNTREGRFMRESPITLHVQPQQNV